MKLSRQSLGEARTDRRRTTPFPIWPVFSEAEIAAVLEVLESGRVNYWTGEVGRAFERDFAAAHGARYGVAVANGTVALEACLEAVGVRPGDDVITTPRTFIASVSAAVRLGARPVFADVDPESQNLTAETIAAVLTSNTRAIVAVHLAGWPCEMDPIMALAMEHGIAVVEDCAQAHGARCHARPVGSLGDVAAFSFCQDKIITTGGEGGLVATNREDLWERVWALRDHGKSFDAVYRRQHGPGFRWLHDSFGTNWRLTEMQAAIGRVQLEKLSEWLAIRRRHASRLNAAFADEPALRTTVPPDHISHAYYRYYVFVRPEALQPGWTRDRLMTAISDRGIPCFSGSCPEVYLERAFNHPGFRPPAPLPIARQLGELSLMFPLHPTITDSDLDDVIEITKAVLVEATA